MARHSAVTNDEMDQLSDAERAALEDEGSAPAAAVDSSLAIPEDGPAAAAAGADDDSAPPAAVTDEEAAAATAAAAAAATPPEGEAGEEAGAEDRDEPFLPRYIAPPVADYDAVMADLNKKFEEAEITLAEYNAQRDNLIRAQTKAEIAAEQNDQLAQQRWDWEVKHFIKDVARSEGIDYNKPVLNAALDSVVKTLATAEDANGNLIHADKDGEWFLAEAHKQIKAEFGLGKAATPNNLPNTPNTPPKGPRNVPKTLAGIPAADIPDTGATDPFKRIDDMFTAGRNEEAEMELAKLSKHDQDRYLRAS